MAVCYRPAGGYISDGFLLLWIRMRYGFSTAGQLKNPAGKTALICENKSHFQKNFIFGYLAISDIHLLIFNPHAPDIL